MERVIVIGAGVAGLTAAHELLKRGFSVDVYEALDLPGGKARSYEVPLTDYLPDPNKKPLPAEHGFRFFPGFYRHLNDVMQSIPYQKKTVLDNLIKIKHLNYARLDEDIVSMPIYPVKSLKHILRMLNMWTSRKQLKLSLRDLIGYSRKIIKFFCSCTARVESEYENLSWWEFLNVDNYSDNYRMYFANGTRLLVAADPRRASARTNGKIAEQLIVDHTKGTADRVSC